MHNADSGDALPAHLIDSLFARLQVRYGAAWLRQWEGVDITAVKADWARELAGFAGNLDAIAHALDHLPRDRPPLVGQFRDLCIARPHRYLALPTPEASPEEREAVRLMLARVRAKLQRGAAR